MCCKKVKESHIDTSAHLLPRQERGQIPLQLHRQLRAARDMPGAPRPASGHTCSTTNVFVEHVLSARCPQGGRLPEMDLMAAPQVADDIIADVMFTHEPAHPDRRQGHGPHQSAQQLRHARHRQSPSARSCTRRRSSSTRAASSTRSSGWHRSARCTSSSPSTSSRTVLDPDDVRDVDQTGRSPVDTRNGRRRRRHRLRLVDRRHYHPPALAGVTAA